LIDLKDPKPKVEEINKPLDSKAPIESKKEVSEEHKSHSRIQEVSLIFEISHLAIKD